MMKWHNESDAAYMKRMCLLAALNWNTAVYHATQLQHLRAVCEKQYRQIRKLI